MEHASRFWKAGELVLDNCVGASATAKACLKLPEHRQSVGYEKDSVCFQEALPSVVEVYAKKAFSPDNDITGCEDSVDTSQVCVKEMADLSSKRRGDSWTVRPGNFTD